MENSIGEYKGTTTVAVVCRDGVVLGTDTRATMGTYIASKNAKKVYQINDKLAMTIAGGVAVAQRIVDILKINTKLFQLEKGRPMPVASAARLVQTILFQNREAGAPLPMQALIGGVDSTGSHVFNLDPYGSLIEEKVVSTGSGSPFAYGVLEDRFVEDSTVEEMKKVVVKAVNAAMNRDVASGDNFDIAIIKEEGYRELTKEEKMALLK